MRFLFHILSLLFFTQALSQQDQLQAVWTQTGVTKLSAQNSGILHFFSEDFDAFEYNGYQSKKCAHEFEDQKAGFHIDANTVSYQGKRCILPQAVSSAQVYKNEMIIVSNRTLYKSPIPLNIVADTLKLEGLEEVEGFDKILVFSNYLLLQDSTDLHVWNYRNKRITSFENRAGEINAAVLDDFGMLFIASAKGLFKLNFLPEQNVKEPLLKVSEDNTHDFRRELKLDSGEIIIYNVEAFHPVLQEEVLVYSQLKFEDEIKEELIEDGTFVLKDLAPGKYSLRFYTKLEGEVHSRFSKKIAIEVKGVESFAVWMYLFGLLGLLLLLSIYSNVRSNTYKASLETQRDKLILENKALKFEQQALQLQMNPHFIFNVLNSISGMVAVKDNEGARKYINEFSQLMRSVLHQSRSEFISLEHEIDYLKKYLSLERITRNSSFEFEVNVPQECNMQLTTLPMIVQPFVENAIVHGFKGKKTSNKIWVTFIPLENKLEVHVRDNGVGRNSKQDKNSGHKSVGLQVVKERLGKKYNFKMIDLKDEQGQPQGTEVIIKMPLK